MPQRRSRRTPSGIPPRDFDQTFFSKSFRVTLDVAVPSIDAVRDALGVGRFMELCRGLPGRPALGTVTWELLVTELSATELAEADRTRRAFVRMALDAAGATCRPFCRFEDVGTVAASSDMDVTVLNTRASIVVRVVEALYRAVFGRSVALMSHFLDVNLYAHAYYDVCRDELVPLERRACDRPVPEAAAREQAILGLTRLVIGDGGSGSLAARMLRLVPASVRGELGRLVASHLGPIPDEARQMAAISRAIAEMERRLSALTDGNRESEYRGYLRSVTAVRHLDHDAFYSYGAYLHVVVAMQRTSARRDSMTKVARVVLTPVELAASFFDNLGFLVRLGPDTSDASPTPPISLKTLKYANRCMDAARRAFGSRRIQKEWPDSASLAALSASAVRCKRDGDAAGYGVALEKARAAWGDDATQLCDAALAPPMLEFLSLVGKGGGKGDKGAGPALAALSTSEADRPRPQTRVRVNFSL